VVERVGSVAYRMQLPDQMSDVHHVFHVSVLRRWIHDPNVRLAADEVDVQSDLSCRVEPERIMDFAICELRSKHILMVRVHWKHQ
ncbi:hypothetical protein, partial [Streptococcus anginosus]|uniref:hypothetical protein n=1 Tax=Streptococcus anginosus TaxID=1328 RepID=UPI002ED78494